jgi:hypothetical protein
MPSSASAIGEAVVSVIESISRVGSGNAHRRGYDIMEWATSQSCFRVRCVRGDSDWSRFGTTTDPLLEDVTVMAEGFVKLLDNYDDWYDEQDNLIDDMKTTFDDEQDLSGTVEWARLERWEIQEYELDVAGVMWQPIHFTIRCLNL